MLVECIRPTHYPNATDPQVIYNQENLKFVKIHFLQQKNHNFFVKQVMKTTVISLNVRPFGLYSKKKSFQKYERLRTCKQ